MREILYRGKRVDNGEWVYGFYIENETFNGSLIPTIISIDEKGAVRFDGEGYNAEVFVTPETVGQYTGLTDKNGTRIFEGDIIKIRLDYSEDDEAISKVYDYNGVLCVDYQTPDYDSTALGFLYGEGVYEFEVIGNIHDNSELPMENKDE